MQQMVNNHAPSLGEIRLGKLAFGFFRKSNHDGKIFFAWLHGGNTSIHIVLIDGSISSTLIAVDTTEIVQVIHPKELKIKIGEINFKDDT